MEKYYQIVAIVGWLLAGVYWRANRDNKKKLEQAKEEIKEQITKALDDIIGEWDQKTQERRQRLGKSLPREYKFVRYAPGPNIPFEKAAERNQPVEDLHCSECWDPTQMRCIKPHCDICHG